VVSVSPEKELVKPEVGRAANLVSFKEGEVLRAGQLAFNLVVDPRGSATGSALGTKLLAKASLKNRLGTDRPPRLVVALDAKDKNTLYLIPSLNEIGDESLKVYYYRSFFRLSLLRLFNGLNLTPLAGQRDIYTLKLSDEPIVTPDLTGYALVLEVGDRVSEPIRVSEVTKLRRLNKVLERKVRREEARRVEQAKVDVSIGKLARE
jgi:hypothetical protein